jgi:hypothetical protein
VIFELGYAISYALVNAVGSDRGKGVVVVEAGMIFRPIFSSETVTGGSGDEG